jgi:hypothetical protein
VSRKAKALRDQRAEAAQRIEAATLDEFRAELASKCAANAQLRAAVAALEALTIQTCPECAGARLTAHHVNHPLLGTRVAYFTCEGCDGQGHVLA